MRNNLFLKRLIILTQNNIVAYDQEYHKGINIIRGDNSSGKSTITHFIFYALGGAFNDWVKEARNCKCVYAETEMNGAIITLKRNIHYNESGRANDKEGIYFFWGKYEEAIKENSEWYFFNYNSSTEKKSFSNVIFNNLEIPIVKGDNIISFHQLLRLIYVDQESPTNSLFYFEQFDTILTRETVAELLLGVYNQDLYDKKQRHMEIDKELEIIKDDLKALKKLISNPFNLVPQNINAQIEKCQQDIEDIESNIIELTSKAKQVRYTSKSKLEFEGLKDESIKQREVIVKFKDRIGNLNLEIEDTKYFIEALENKLKAIKNSIVTRKFLGDFSLEFCPECLTEIKPSEEKNICKLCKNPIEDNIGVTKARKIEQEIYFQIKESQKIVSLREKDLVEAKSKYESEQIKLHLLQEKVNSSLIDVDSYREEKINQLYVDKGFLEGNKNQLYTFLENANMFQELLKRQIELEQAKNILNSAINKIIGEQEKLKSDISIEIERKGIFLLNNDLKRQDEFFEAKEFHVDFRNNIAFISDKEAKYSASSSFYLKIAARFSIFLASLEIERMRFPRFIICDNMEDKGIEKERAQNFQEVLIKEVENYDNNNYQIIYTTSFIPDIYNDTSLCVGEYYTEQNRSLKHV